MKKLSTLCALSALLIISTHSANAAQSMEVAQKTQSGQISTPASTVKLSGRSVSGNGSKIEFATVIAFSQSDTTRFYGSTSDTNGYFALQVPRGKYRIDVSFLGYDKSSQNADITTDKNLGDVVLKENSVAIKSVEVRANVISREADRFVVNVANSPLAIGKSASEMLSLSPGVWITKDEISVGSKGGTKVMVNDRLLHYSGEDLIRYLETIKAEDIQKIEVIPSTGADFDANASGGMIKITLKRQRDNGLDGSVKLRYEHSLENGANRLTPAVSINYKEGKTNLYTNIDYYKHNFDGQTTESTDFKTNPNKISSNSDLGGEFKGFNIRVGAIQELNSKHSIGAEVTYRDNNSAKDINSDLILKQGSNNTDVTSHYMSDAASTRFGASANYIVKMDTLGSTLKLILDYNNSDSNDPTDYFSAYRGYENFDTTYRSQINTRNDIYSANLDFEKILSKRSKLKTGAKYVHNIMDNSSMYDYFKNDEWNKIENISNTNSYTEDIGALYATFSTKTKSGIGLVLGLRGEYTYAVPETSSIQITDKQNYFGLFPNANLSIPLGKKKSESIALSYSRRIRRPSFYQLNPFRTPLSEYSYISGNPRLNPSYSNDINATFILKQKYSATLGATFYKGDIAQTGMVDPNNKDVIVYIFENIQNSNYYYMSINIPANIRPWWSVNANLYGVHQEIELNNIKRTNNTFRGNLSQTFTIAKKYYIGIEAFYMSDAIVGNMKASEMFVANVNIKRNFAKNKFTASIYLNDVFNSNNLNITVREPDFIKKTDIQENWRTLGFSISYNFRYGKTFKARSIESAAGDEKSRLQ